MRISATTEPRPASDSFNSALTKIAGRHISTFDLLTEDEYEEGRGLAERELPAQIEVETRWLIAIAER